MLKDPALRSRWTRSPRKLEVHMSTATTSEPIEEVDSPDAPVDIAMEFVDFDEVLMMQWIYYIIKSYLITIARYHWILLLILG